MAVSMDDDNVLELTPQIKQVFIQDMRESGKRISVQSIHNAIRVLKKQGFIREVARSTYRVSRKLYSKVQGDAESSPMNAE
jgi:predicted transcriptional regulator